MVVVVVVVVVIMVKVNKVGDHSEQDHGNYEYTEEDYHPYTHELKIEEEMIGSFFIFNISINKKS